MPTLLEEISRLQNQLTDLDDHERTLLKMVANLLESHHRVKKPKNKMNIDEYLKIPGRFELINGMLYYDGME